jgi:hypothetical protein
MQGTRLRSEEIVKTLRFCCVVTNVVDDVLWNRGGRQLGIGEPSSPGFTQGVGCTLDDAPSYQLGLLVLATVLVLEYCYATPHGKRRNPRADPTFQPHTF